MLRRTCTTINQHLSCVCIVLHTQVFMRVLASSALIYASWCKPPLGTKLGTVEHLSIVGYHVHSSNGLWELNCQSKGLIIPSGHIWQVWSRLVNPCKYRGFIVLTLQRRPTQPHQYSPQNPPQRLTRRMCWVHNSHYYCGFPSGLLNRCPSLLLCYADPCSRLAAQGVLALTSSSCSLTLAPGQ